MSFKTVEDIQEAFKNKSGGFKILPRNTYPTSTNLTYDSINENREVLAGLLETDYNKVSGFSFPEIMEALSYIKSNSADEYITDAQTSGDSFGKSISESYSRISEDFSGTTQAQQQFPILNQGLVLYMYEKSVLPYLAHIFDLKGARGLAYYMKLNATEAMGDANKDDLIASPREISKQTTNFVGTRVNNLEVETTTASQKDYTFAIPNAPIMPQTLVLTVDGVSGTIEDVSTSMTGLVELYNKDGSIADVQVNLNDGSVTMSFRTTPSTSGVSIKASYNRDVQTLAGSTNIAEVTPSLQSVLLKAEDFSVKTITNLQQQRLAQVTWGLDWNEEVDNMLGMVYNRELANRVTKDLKEAVPTDSIGEYDLTPNANSGDNRLFSSIFANTVPGRLEKMITQASGIQGINRLSALVVNLDLKPLLGLLDKYHAIEGNEDFMSGMALIGTYDGIPVLAPVGNSILASGEIMGLYKSKKQAFLTPAVLGTFILPIIRDVYDMSNLSINHKQLISSAAVEVVCPTLVSRITVTGLDAVGLL